MLTEKETYWRNVGVGSVVVPRGVDEVTETEEERWGWFLVETAKGSSENPCPDGEGGCEICNLFDIVWWDKYAALPRYVRMAVQRVLIRHDIPLPANPRFAVVE